MVIDVGGHRRINPVWELIHVISIPFRPANMPADAINLGQGFMSRWTSSSWIKLNHLLTTLDSPNIDWKPPQWVRDASTEAMNNDMMSNHYSHPRGRPRLLKAISKYYSPQFENLVREGRELKNEEIVVTAGANEGEWMARERWRGSAICVQDTRCLISSTLLYRHVLRTSCPSQPRRRGHLH